MNDKAGFVSFVDVGKSYDGERLVIEHLDLAIHEGEFLTLLGPSGSGKTTTLMMLAGFEEPTTGEIRLAGESLARLPPYRRNFGMVFQDYSLFPHMTVRENVAFPLATRRRTAEEIGTRVRQALEMVRLEAFGDRRPNQLSGGQQQRVALARALVFGPRLVLMDEPLGALDKQLREQMQLEIKHIQKRLGITAVYVTHDQQEALTMSDRIAVFDRGRILQLGTPDELYERPRNAFVARFIGENNRLEGVVTALDRAGCTIDLDGGGRVVATPVDVSGIGARALVSVRPERVIVEPGPGVVANRFAARVEEVIYLGDHARASLALGGAQTMIVKLANSGGARRPLTGASLEIGWAQADCLAFDVG